jgi:autotransporter translocation and assembly factor TamB
MRRFIAFFCVIAALLMPMTTSCSTSRHNAGRDLHPDDVFTMTEDDIANETRRINLTLQGDWKYNAPSVGVSGKNLLAGIAKPIAKGKLKKKLKNAYKKIGLDKVRPQFVFNVDGTCSMKLMGASVKGTYNYNPTTEKITFKWHGVPMNASLKRDGKKKLQLTFDADKLLSLMSLLGRFSDSSTIKALSTLLDNYEDVMVGFELKKQ